MPFPRTPSLSRRLAAAMPGLNKPQQRLLAETPGRSFDDFPIQVRALVEQAERQVKRPVVA